MLEINLQIFRIILGLLLAIVSGSAAQNSIQASCEKNEVEGGVQCADSYLIPGSESKANMWDEKVTIGEFYTDSINFTRIPLGIYDLEPRVRQLTLNNVALNSIEAGDVIGLKRLLIDMSNIEALGANVFSQSPDMEALMIVSSKLTEIHEDAFKGLNELKALQISENRLKTVTKKTFDHLTTLEVFHLTMCDLTEIPADMFKSFKDLAFLDLANNHLTSFNSATLGISSSLRFLQIYGNKISSLNVANLPNMETLLMSENELTTLNCGMISCGRNYEKIDLDENKIESVYPKIFETNPNLKLSLKKNPCNIPMDEDIITDEAADQSFKNCFAGF